MTTITSSKVAYSCVVDKDPDFFFQSLYFIASLFKLSSVKPNDIFIHLVRGTDPTCAEIYNTLGVRVVWIEPFSEAVPYCNKILQLSTADFDCYHQLVLCDCDIAFRRNIESEIIGKDLAAKIVDLANPPLITLERIAIEAGLQRPSQTQTTFRPTETGSVKITNGFDQSGRTLMNNCNGGLYVVTSQLRTQLLEAWSKEARWLLEKTDLLGSHHSHADQVAFALATWKLKKQVELLDAGLNFPTHLPLDGKESFQSPSVIHFHRQFDDKGYLKKTNIPTIDAAIDEIEGAHQSLLRDIKSEDSAPCKAVALKRQRWIEWNNTIANQPLKLPKHMENELPLIAIETIGQCQYTCSYCPVSVNPKRKGRLEIGDIELILEEISKMDGQIQLRFHFYNEPTLDNRLDGIISSARAKLPNTYMRLVTNGDLLDSDLIVSFFSAGINQIAVSCHQEEVFRRLSALLPTLEPRRDIELRETYRNSLWSDRLNSVDLASQGYAQTLPAGVKPWGCSYLTAQIDFQGNVHACCEDFHGKLIQGNIRKDSLLEIRQRAAPWTKQVYCGFFTGICRKCAMVGTAKSAALIDAATADSGSP